jgi:ribosomal protein L7/L12
MDQWQWWATFTVLFIVWQWLALLRSNVRLKKRILNLEIRFHKLQDHIGFVADANPPITEDVKVLARTPGSKIAAIKLYRQQTGAGLKEAKDAVERMERS